MSRNMLLKALVLATLAVSPATAFCSYDRFGNYTCDGLLSNSARYGIGVTCIVLAVIGIIMFRVFRRRRALLANNIYRMNQQTAMPYQPPQGAYNPDGYQQPYQPPYLGPGGPQVPPQAFVPQSGYGAPPPPGYAPPSYVPREQVPPVQPPVHPPPMGPPPGLKETV